MRNAVQRRNHKERAQPLERSKWGLLEKHKDNKLRAHDHNDKKKRLRALRQKASERNPDEFAFRMLSSTTKNGVKITERGGQNGNSGSLDVDLVKLLKTQDAGYLRTVLQQTKNELARLREQSVLLAQGVNVDVAVTDLNRRKTFDEDGNEVADLAMLREDGGDDGEDDLVEPLDKDKKKAKKKRQRTIEVLNNKLEATADREAQLSRALEAVEQQRAKMEGTIGGVNKNGVQFRMRERKR